MDNLGQQEYSEQREILNPYQKQQMNNWKNSAHKLLIDVWPSINRAINELLLLVFKLVRGGFRIAKEQLFSLKG